MNSGVQKQVAEFVEEHGLEAAVPYRLLDLVSEVGELSKEQLKATNYGRQAKLSEDTSGPWEEEVGDVFFSLICLANETGVDLERALAKALDKYEKRLESKRDAGSGS